MKRLVARLAVLVLAGSAAIAAGCQITTGAGRFASAPRAKPRVRVGVVALRPELAEPVIAGLRRDPHVDAVVLYEAVDALSPEERSICWSAECQPAHPTVCAWAREQGLDYFAFAHFSGGDRTVTAPGSSTGLSLDIHASSTSPGKTLSYVAFARLRLEVSETATCTKDNHLSRKLERSTSDGPSRGGGPDGVRRALLAEIPAHLAKTFPAQVVVADTGRVRATDPELPLSDGDYAVYRDGRFQGVTALRDAAAPAQRLARLTCCFDPRPADVLVHGKRPILIEMTASLTLTQLAWDGSARLTAGPGFRVRFGPMARGWQAGLVADLLYVDGVSAGVGTIEGGYHLRPGPAWTIAVVAGAGGGAASTSAASAAGQGDATGLHVMGALVTTFQPGPDWFLTADLGYVHSARYNVPAGATLQPAFELRGLLFRLAGGLR